MVDFESRRAARIARNEAIATRRKSQLVAVVVVCLCLMVVLVTGFTFAPKQKQQDTRELVSVIIQPGDSLWSIAAEHPVKNLRTEELVDFIASVNNIHNSKIIAGDQINIPAQ